MKKRTSALMAAAVSAGKMNTTLALHDSVHARVAFMVTHGKGAASKPEIKLE